MTVGVYILRFKGTKQVYIGQSITIEKRFISHINSFNNRNAPKKLLSAFDAFGYPHLEILCECEKAELDDLEDDAIELFDSCINGFNTKSKHAWSKGASNPPYGENNVNSKHSNKTYIEIFLLLVDNILSRKTISELLCVNEDLVACIDQGYSHKWIKQLYPEEYSILEKRRLNYVHGSKVDAKSQGLSYPIIVSPEGQEYEITNISKFAREFNLIPQNLSKLLNKQTIQCKGWTLKGCNILVPKQILSPDGTIFFIPYQGLKLFAKTNKLNYTELSNLMNGKIKHLKGWTVPTDMLTNNKRDSICL